MLCSLLMCSSNETVLLSKADLFNPVQIEGKLVKICDLVGLSRLLLEFVNLIQYCELSKYVFIYFTQASKTRTKYYP